MPRCRCASASTNGSPSAGAATQPPQPTAAADAVNQEQAWQLLQEFTRLNARGLDQGMLDSAAKRERLRTATLVRAETHSLKDLYGITFELYWTHSLKDLYWVYGIKLLSPGETGVFPRGIASLSVP